MAVVTALSASLLLIGSRGYAQSDEELSIRRVALERAQQASAAGDHAQALSFATRAGAIQMTPSVRFFIAREQSAVGQHAAALLTAQSCMRDATRATDVSNRAEILTGCRALATQEEARVGTLVIEAPTPAIAGLEVRVRDAVVTATLYGLPYVVDPGSVVVTATAPGYERFESAVDVNAGETRTVPLRMTRAATPAEPPPSRTAEPVPRASAPLPPQENRVLATPAPTIAAPARTNYGPIVTMGLGGAVLLAGILTLGALADATDGCTLDGRDTAVIWVCDSDRTDREISEALASAPVLQGVGGTLAGVGAASLVGGLVWWLVAPRSEARAVVVAPQVTSSATGLLVGGRF